MCGGVLGSPVSAMIIFFKAEFNLASEGREKGPKITCIHKNNKTEQLGKRWVEWQAYTERRERKLKGEGEEGRSPPPRPPKKGRRHTIVKGER